MEDEDKLNNVTPSACLSFGESQSKKQRKEDHPLSSPSFPENAWVNLPSSSVNNVSSTCQSSVFLHAAATLPLLSTSEAQSFSQPYPSSSTDCQSKEKYKNIIIIYNQVLKRFRNIFFLKHEILFSLINV